MIPVPAQYITHDPPLGNWRWLKQVPLKYLNGQQVYPPASDFKVWRWSRPLAQIAERIALREWERIYGWEDAQNKAGYIQYMVQLMALEQCGALNAMAALGVELTHPNIYDTTTKHAWNWPAWACFCRFFAGLNQEQQLYLLNMLFQNDCAWTHWFFNLPVDNFVYFDQWYEGTNVYQLPEKGPFPFGVRPYGAPEVVEMLPPEYFPPDKRPPMEVPVEPPPPVEPPAPFCPEGMIPGEDGSCQPASQPPATECIGGVIDPITGACVVVPSLPPSTCAPGQVLQDGQCLDLLPMPSNTQCPPGSVYDPVGSMCVTGGAQTIGAKQDGKVSGIEGWQIAAGSLLGLAGIGIIIGTFANKRST